SNKILEILMLRFGAVVIDQEVTFNLRLEAIKTINSMLDNASKESRKRLCQTNDHDFLLEEFAKVMIDVGDYEMQVAISEALCRLSPKKQREELVGKWFSYRSFASAFTTIRVKEFETDCRIFLNKLNSYFGASRSVFSFPCIRAFLGFSELFKPEDELLQQFWVDFNVGTSCISFYVNDPEGTLWELIHLPKEAISTYSLQESDDQKTLIIHMSLPVTHGDVSDKMVLITFDSQHDIQTALEKVFVREKSPEAQVSFVLQSGPGKLPSPKSRLAPVEDPFCLRNSSDTEVTVSETLKNTFLTDVSERSCDRKSKTITFMAALWRYQVVRAKAVIFGLPLSSNGSGGSVKSLPVGVEQVKSAQKRKLRMFHSESDTYVLPSERRPSRDAPHADYTRKRPRQKIKLKVLPLSSPSSMEEEYFKAFKTRLYLKIPFLQMRNLMCLQRHMIYTKSHLQGKHPWNHRQVELCVETEMTEMQPEGEELPPFSTLKPRRLFPSTSMESATETVTQALVEDEESETELGSGVIAAFDTFKAQLREHFSSRYKKIEAKSLRSLTDCQENVSSLLRTVHDQRLVHLDHFQDTVVQQLGHLEQNCLSLKHIEQETVRFWQSESDRVRSFCDRQHKRVDSIEVPKETRPVPQSCTEGMTSASSDLYATLSMATLGNKVAVERQQKPSTVPTTTATS
ncbi:hypothetical protein P4O66_004950, partial [Electrophorus voltai]